LGENGKNYASHFVSKEFRHPAPLLGQKGAGTLSYHVLNAPL
jgi:hypothetical protein